MPNYRPRPLTIARHYGDAYDIGENAIFKALIGGRQWVRELILGTQKSFLFYGPPGIGKTYTVEQVVKELNAQMVTIRPGTALGLLQCLYDYRHVQLLMIDDMDGVWSSEPTLNILKTALDSKSRRILRHDTKSEWADIPEFEVTQSIVFISNKDFTSAKTFGNTRIWDSSVLPIKSRSIVYGLSFDPRTCYGYTAWLASDGGMLKREVYLDLPLGTIIGSGDKEWKVEKWNRRLQLNRDQSNHVLTHFHKNAYRYPGLSPRELRKLAVLRIGKRAAAWEAQVEPLLTGDWTLNPDNLPIFQV